MSQLYNSPQRRILMLDDDNELRTMLGLILASEGYSVSHADNGSNAIMLHNQNPFDLIITELILEDKDGFQTLMELRRHSAPVKFIAMAKENWLSNKLCLRMAKHLGAHCVLAKPIPPEQLLAAVRSALD
jgi:DNA-binding response OmpR family regulator